MVNLATTSGTPADAELASALAALRFFLTEKISIDTILVLYSSWFSLKDLISLLQYQFSVYYTRISDKLHDPHFWTLPRTCGI